jgi:hypothetical protein
MYVVIRGPIFLIDRITKWGPPYDFIVRPWRWDQLTAPVHAAAVTHIV